MFFGESIVSDWGNPAATTARAVVRALTAAGHDALFLEERRNRPTVELLRARGAGAMRSFTERYADLPYRTYELPTGLERTVWFVRQIATADAIVILDGTPNGIIEEAAQSQSRHQTLVRWSAHPNPAAYPWAHLNLAPITATSADSTVITLGPAVESSTLTGDGQRSDLLLIAYDDAVQAEAVRQALSDLAAVCLSAGSVQGDAWTFVPEVALPDAFATARLAVVTGAGDNPFSAARRWLPLSAGCTVIAGDRDPVAIADEVAEILDQAPARVAPPLPDVARADLVAERLIEVIRQQRAVRSG